MRPAVKDDYLNDNHGIMPTKLRFDNALYFLRDLSEGRCKEVRRAMIERGILPSRIEIEGRGERDPIVPNDSDDNRQMNRRVEIVLL